MILGDGRHVLQSDQRLREKSWAEGAGLARVQVQRRLPASRCRRNATRGQRDLSGNRERGARKSVPRRSADGQANGNGPAVKHRGPWYAAKLSRAIGTETWISKGSGGQYVQVTMRESAARCNGGN